MTPEERSARAKKAAQARWAKEPDRAGKLADIRKDLTGKFDSDEAKSLHYQKLSQMRWGHIPNGPAMDRPPCGTLAGWSGHKRYSEKICDSCLEAKRTSARESARRRSVAERAERNNQEKKQ